MVHVYDAPPSRTRFKRGAWSSSKERRSRFGRAFLLLTSGASFLMLLVSVSLWYRSEPPFEVSKDLGARKTLDSKATPAHDVVNTASARKQQPRGPVDIETANFTGGLSYQLPPEWNRLHSPWFCPPNVHLLTPEESNHRYLYLPTRLATSDGIGHSMGVANYAFNFALRFNLTYTHRLGLYSSLTAYDRLAVERFFGWGDGEVPRSLVRTQGCVPENGIWPSEAQKYECQLCEKPLHGGAMQIRHFIQIPVEMESNCHVAEELCLVITDEYVKKHNRSHTLFQAPKESCRVPPTDANYLHTKNLFYHKYWNRHGQLLWRNKTTRTTRPISYNESELNVAIHVRRGDFLDASGLARREITEDAVFAKVLVDALSLVHEHGGSLAKMPVAVHIYSEGKLIPGRVSSVHAINLQDRNYYDSTGVVRDMGWWQELIAKAQTNSKLGHIHFRMDKIRVIMHISQQTLRCLHEMVSADIFIGSKSGLSNSLVWSLSRGLVLIPSSGPLKNEMGKKGNICCSMPFENKNGNFQRDLFRQYWEVYAEANELSAHHELNV